MVGAMVFFGGVFLVVGLAVRERARQLSRRYRSADIAVAASPMANALTYLVGIAGSIYMALSLLVDFLGIAIPNRISLGSLELEPLAAVAIAIAVLQPFLLQIYQYEKNRGRD